jgi:ABC-type transport system involved in cytochrome bd biosynthesis fused ATPase/permease subunit
LVFLLRSFHQLSSILSPSPILLSISRSIGADQVSLSTGPTAFLLRPSLFSSPYTIHSTLFHNTTNTHKKKNTNKTLNDPGMLQPSRNETLPVAHRAFSVTPDLARVRKL